MRQSQDDAPLHNGRAWKVLAALVACTIFTAANDAEDAGAPPVSGMRQHAVALDNFVQLHAGMTTADVEKLLGKRGEHQFTYVDDDGHVWQCEQYSVAKDPKYASSGFDLLYKNGRLYALIDHMDRWNRYKALAEAKPKKEEAAIEKVAYDDDSWIRETFRVKSIRGDEIANSMAILKKRVLDGEEQMRRIEKRNPPDPGLTVVVTVFNLLNPSQRSQMKIAYKENAECMRKFDGGRIAIGMTEAQVQDVFGEPLLREKLNDKRHAAIYGPKDTTNIALVQAYLRCSPVMVLYESGAVLRVLSNWNFAADWQDKVWPELKQP